MRVPRFDLRSELVELPSSGTGVGFQAGGFSWTGDTPLDWATDDELELEGMSYQHIFRYVATSAWALRPEVLAVLKEIIAHRVQGHRLPDEEIEARIGATIEQRREAAVRRGNAVRRRGTVGLMSLYGMIAPKASMVQSVSGPSGTGLDAFTRQLRILADDPEIASIVIDVNSPGGSVDMVPETAQQIRNARDRKPVYANANTDAGSAAYWLGSQASELVATPSGAVGSIGVYTAHTDRSAQMEAEGVKTTLVSAGKYKTEFNPFEALGEEARANVQEMVDGYYNWFVSDVAEGRGVKVADVRSGFGEGRMVVAKKALAEGMIDRIETLEQTVERAMNGGRVPGQTTASSADPVTVQATEPEGAADHYEYVDL